MAVKVYCSVTSCGTFIKDVEKFEFEKLSGDEICHNCANIYQEVRNYLNEYRQAKEKDMEKKHSTLKQKYQQLDKAFNKFHSEVANWQATADAELKRKMENLLE